MGLNTAGMPVPSFPLTGAEMMAADTGIGNGSANSQVAVSSKLIHLFAAAPTPLTYASTLTLDGSTSSAFDVTLTGNAALAFTNIPPGRVIRVAVTQDATGSRTLTYPANVKWPAGAAPTLSTTAGYIDVLTFFVDNVSGFILGTSAIGYH